MKTRMSARPVAVILAAALAFAGAAFHGAAWAGKDNDTLVVAFQRPIRNVDRLYSTPRESLIVAQLTDDGLFYVDPETLEYKPLVAESHSFPDDKTLVVKLREGVKFHDGSPLTADDVVYTLEWMLNPTSETRQGAKIRRWLENVEKVDERTVRLKMKFAYPLALRDLAVSVQLRKRGSYGGEESKREQSFAVNGVGPYRVADFKPGKKVELERFEDYYEGGPKGRGAIQRIVIRTIPDIGTQQAELIAGGVNFLYNIPTDVAENIGLMGDRARRLVGPDMRIGFLAMDAGGVAAEDGPFTRLAVRRAVNHAIDREGIVHNIVRGEARVIHSACHPAQFGCEQDVEKYGHDLGKARALLAKAGLADGFEFDLWAYREKNVAEAVAADLAKAGITAKLRYVKSSTLAKARRSREIEVYFGSWGSGGTADAAMIAGEHFALESDRNLSADDEISELMLAAERTADFAARKEAYSRAMKLIAERALWVPLYAYSLNYLISKDVDFTPPRDGLPRLHMVRWK